MAVVTKKTIDDFYKKKRIAVIGASRSKAKYGRHLFEELGRKGYDAVAVNPNADKIGDKECFKSIKDVKPGVEAVIVLVPPAQQDTVVLECAAAGVKDIWLHEHVMKGLSNPKAIYLCEEKGMNVISGYCPFMFMPGTAPFHKFHGMIMKMLGAYPK